MLPLLFLGVAAMTLSLNLNGYVKDTHSPIFVKSLAQFARPVSLASCTVLCVTESCSLKLSVSMQGGLFAADSKYYGWLIPTILHSLIISVINKLYSSVAEKCTELENHR